MHRIRNIVFGLGLAAAMAAGPGPFAHAAPPAHGGRPMPHGKLGPQLFLAIGQRNLAGVKALLAHGADPNARNFLEFTPLMFAAASGQLDAVQTLLAAGAKLDAASPYGTALTFAGLGGSVPILQYLLEKGANPNPQRADKITSLMLAARDGQTEIAQTLLDKKLDVNARDNDEGTALTYAARNGKTEVVRLLLERGAVIDSADSQGWTPLTHAALNGYTECVRFLIDKGADVNVRDKKGRTPLVVVSSYADQPSVIAALLERGADPRAKDSRNRTALALAEMRGRTETAKVLRDQGTDPVPAMNPVTQKTPQAAAKASLALLQHSMQLFSERTGCVSCHQEGLGRIATGQARDRGFAINTALAQEQAKRISGMLAEMRPLLVQAVKDPKFAINVPSVEIGELTPTFTYVLAGQIAHKQPANEAFAAAAMILARQQQTDGHWQFVFARVPIQSSPFTMTALAAQVMKTYGPKAYKAETAQRLARAKAWLASAPAETTEDRASRLLGLKWAGASPAERRKAAEELRAAQRPDGGWAQLDTLASDAYATGQALCALNDAGGLPVTDPIYQRGLRFLLQTQDEDGSWFINKRAIPANNYFDAGFPHGQSQYASFGATCWATMALMRTIDLPAPPHQTASR